MHRRVFLKSGALSLVTLGLSPSFLRRLGSFFGLTVRQANEDSILLTASALAFVTVLSLIPLLTVKDSEFVKWNAKQGLVLFIGLIVLGFINVIPFVGQLVWCVGFIGYVVAVILGITKSLKGQRFAIPLISDLASKF